MKILSFYDMQDELVYGDYQIFCLKGTVKHDLKINVWDCFTASGVGDLHLIEGNMDISSTNKSLCITWYPVSQGYIQIRKIVFFNRIMIIKILPR